MRLPVFLAQPYDFLKQVATEFSEDNGPIVAAAIAFYIFISLVPLLLLGVAALGFVLRSEDHALRIVFGFLQTYSPALAEEGQAGIRSLVEDVVRGRGAIGGIGLLGLIWAGTQAFANLHRAVNIAWDAPDDRGFLKTRLLALGLLLAVGLILLTSIGLTALLNIIRGYDLPFIGFSPGDIPFIWSFLAYAAPLIVSIAVFTLMYKVMPTRPVPLSAALLSGTLAALMWEVAKHAFGWYVANVANFSALYGSLGGLIIMIFWIYYSAMVLVIAAEVGAVYGKRTGQMPSRQRSGTR